MTITETTFIWQEKKEAPEKHSAKNDKTEQYEKMVTS